MTVLARLLHLRQRRPLFVVVASLTLCWLFAFPFLDWYLRANDLAPAFQFWDWGAYSSAVKRWLSGESVYVRNESGGYHGTYLYPPIFLVLVLPFRALTFDAGALAWEITTVVFLWESLQLVIGALGANLRWWEQLALLWLLVGFHPLLIGIKLGQTPALLTGLLCLSLAFVLSDEYGGNEFVGGALTAFVACVKLPYAPAGAHLLRSRTRFLGAVTGGIAFVLASLTVFGPATNRQFLTVLQWGMEAGSSARSPRLWLPPYYRPFYGVPGRTAIRVLIAGGISALVLLASSTVSGDDSAFGVDREVFALGAAAIPLLAPKTYSYYLVAALPAVVALLAVELDRVDVASEHRRLAIAGRPTIPVLALALLAVHPHGLRVLGSVAPAWIPPTPSWRFLLTFLQPGLWGNLLLVGLAAVRVGEAIEWSALSLTPDFAG